tara:strand:+ start:130 stop:738 length:609 start_codon:yes stop_codon:yes gene_type:complete
MFICFDGIDGTGKSTQIELLTSWLAQQGLESITCRDPGSTAVGESLREIVLQGHDLDIHRTTEMFLYMTARAQLVEEVIKPAIASDKVVVSDRFLLANVVYQGHAGGLDPDSIWQVGHVATSGMHPNITIVLDLDVQTAASRINRELDRIEAQGIEYMDQVRRGFLLEAENAPDTIKVINADNSPEQIHERIIEVVAPLLQP